MKKFLIIVSLLCICEVGVYAQNSTDERKANREKRKTQRVEKREDRREKKVKNKTEVETEITTTVIEEIQEKVVAESEQEQPILTTKRETIVNKEIDKDKENVSGISTQVESLTKEKETNVIVPSKREVVNEQEFSETSSSTTDEDYTYIVVILGIVVLFKILKRIFANRCGKCGRFGAMRTVDEQYLGRSKTKIEKDRDGQRCLVHYNNIKVVRQCKHCGYTKIRIEERKE